MRLALALVAAATLGCSPAPFYPQAQCEVRGLGTALFQGAPDCQRYAALAADAHTTLVGAGVVQEARWGPVLGHESVWVRASDALFRCVGGSVDALGCQWNEPVTLESNIELQQDGGSLLHELLHRWDVVGLGHSDAQTLRHEGWQERGWFDLDRAFEARWVVHGSSSP